MSSRTKALLAIVAASMLWATAGTAKVLLQSFDPFTTAFFRFLVASLVILPFFLKERRHQKLSLLPLVPLALLGTANITLFYFGLRTTTANATAVIYTIIPLVVAVAAPKLIKEQVTATKLVGVGVGLAGALGIVILPTIERGQRFSGDLSGNLLVLMGVLCWSGYTIGSRHMLATKRATPVAMTAASIFISTAIFALLSLPQWKPAYLAAFTGVNVLIILQLGVFVTVVTYLLLQWAIKHSSATTAALNQYLQPVFAVVFNYFFLGERLTVGLILGGIVVIAGVGIATGGPLIRELRRWKMLRGA